MTSEAHFHNIACVSIFRRYLVQCKVITLDDSVIMKYGRKTWKKQKPYLSTIVTRANEID